MKYQNLTPVSEIESQVYFEALDEEVDDETVKNSIFKPLCPVLMRGVVEGMGKSFIDNQKFSRL